MAVIPASGTNIRLLSGIPFSSDYKHTRWFDTKAAQESYFLGKPTVHTMTEAAFQPIEGVRGRIIAVNKSIDELYATNYVMFQNAQYNNKWFYGFVTKLEYKQRNTTWLHFDIDVFQTWKFEMNFKPSYVAREHCQLWNTDGSPVVNTVDEGLDYGHEYDIKAVNQYTPNNSLMFLVVVAKSTIHDPTNQIRPCINGSAQSLSYYFHPFTSTGGAPQYLFMNGEFQMTKTLNEDMELVDVPYTLPNVLDIMRTIYTNSNAVNNIVSMYVTEHVGLQTSYNSGLLSIFNDSYTSPLELVQIAGSGLKTIFVQSLYAYSQTTIDVREKYLDFGGIKNGASWSFPETEESKLLMYPYSEVIMDDFRGNRVTIKPEYIDGDALSVNVMGSMGLSNKVAYIPTNYLTNGISGSINKKYVAIENALIDSTPHDVTIINDMLAAFVQGNRNTMKNQADTILFNGAMGMLSGAIGGASSAAMRNPIGFASSAVDVVSGGGNAVLQMQGLQAKLKDIDNTPPSIGKQGSNTAFEYGNGYMGFWIISKSIKPEYKKKLTDFWKMYGYKLNEVKIPNFHTRQNWNYVQTVSCNITGNFNNEDLRELKAVFDNGITLWHTDDVGNYSLSNGVI